MNIELLLASLMLSDITTKVYLTNRQIGLNDLSVGFFLVNAVNDRPRVKEFAIKTWFPRIPGADFNAPIPTDQIRLFAFTDESSDNPVFWLDGSQSEIFEILDNIWARVTVKTNVVNDTQETLGYSIPVRLRPNGIGVNPPKYSRTHPMVIEELLSITSDIEISSPDAKPTNVYTPAIPQMPDYITEAVKASVSLLDGTYNAPFILVRMANDYWPDIYQITIGMATFAVTVKGGEKDGQQLALVGAKGYDSLCNHLSHYNDAINCYLRNQVAKPVVSMVIANLPQMVLTLQLMKSLEKPITADNILGATNEFGPLNQAIIDIMEVSDERVTIDVVTKIPTETDGDSVEAAQSQQRIFTKSIKEYINGQDSLDLVVAEIDNFHVTHPNISRSLMASALIDTIFYRNHDLCLVNGVTKEAVGKIISWVLWKMFTREIPLDPFTPVEIDVVRCSNATEQHHAIFEMSNPYVNLVNFQEWLSLPDVRDFWRSKVNSLLNRYNSEKVKEILQGEDKYLISPVLYKGVPSKAFKLVKL